MYVKLPLEDLNLSPYPPHPTNIYTYRVTTESRVCGGDIAIRDRERTPYMGNLSS